ncbi:MAG: tetratricopeptide repeat protein [Sulfurimonadaceae bacterium]|nr:tetratricopeptide repeat protein [Sulfurimonadaceae bacterium]
MSTFQLLMLIASGYFAFRIYQHIQTLQDPQNQPMQEEKPLEVEHIDLVSLADEEFEKGNLKEALSLLEDAHSNDRYNPELLFKLGFISAQLDQDDMALRYYKDSIEIDDRDEFVHNAIASLYRKIGELDEAREHLEESLKLDSTNAKTYYNYGNLLVEMGELDEAKDMYTKALEIDPEFSEAKEELAKL